MNCDTIQGVFGMLSKDIRSTFLNFFEGKDHLVLQVSLIPRDPTLLLIGAGMAR